MLTPREWATQAPDQRYYGRASGLCQREGRVVSVLSSVGTTGRKFHCPGLGNLTEIGELSSRRRGNKNKKKDKDKGRGQGEGVLKR